MTFADPELIDPVIHCYTRCPWCKKLVPMEFDEHGLFADDRLCPKCGAHMPAKLVAERFFENFYHTLAITSANKFVSLDLAVVPFLAAHLLVTLMDFPIWFRMVNAVFYLSAVILGLRWFYKFWYIARFEDEEYRGAVGLMARYLSVWVGALLIVWISLVIELFL